MPFGNMTSRELPDPAMLARPRRATGALSRMLASMSSCLASSVDSVLRLPSSESTCARLTTTVSLSRLTSELTDWIISWKATRRMTNSPKSCWPWLTMLPILDC